MGDDADFMLDTEIFFGGYDRYIDHLADRHQHDTFRQFLIAQAGLGDAIGDLGLDVLNDVTSHDLPDDIEVWRQHLRDHAASDDAFETLDEAWALYSGSR